MHSFITIKLDYCNSLFCGLPEYLIYRLHSSQNAAARLITLTKKHDHITSIVKQLQVNWLPMNQHMKFKILVFAFKCFNGLVPVHLSDLIGNYRPTPQTSSV